MLANRIVGRPNRLIRRTYLLAIRRARSSIDITSGVLSPRTALPPCVARSAETRRASAGAGSRHVGRLSGESSRCSRRDRQTSCAMTSRSRRTSDRCCMQRQRCSTDGLCVIGSHNLDTFSWCFDLEANVLVDDRGLRGRVPGIIRARSDARFAGWIRRRFGRAPWRSGSSRGSSHAFVRSSDARGAASLRPCVPSAKAPGKRQRRPRASSKPPDDPPPRTFARPQGASGSRGRRRSPPPKR